jgi:hypothetical protein
MRIFEDRYFRDLRPLRLAAQMLELEARTQTICIWTGLSRDRIRKLAGSMLPSGGREARVRHRGRSPRQTAYFFRSPRIQTHASVIGRYFSLMGLTPENTIPAKAFPSVPRGELLCLAYGTYYATNADILIDFERAILLATALAQRDEVDLIRCGDCGGWLLIDRLAKDTESSQLCEACRFPVSNADISLRLNQNGISEPEQMRLFDGTEETEPFRLNSSTANTYPRDAESKSVRAAASAVTSNETKVAVSIRDTPEPTKIPSELLQLGLIRTLVLESGNAGSTLVACSRRIKTEQGSIAGSREERVERFVQALARVIAALDLCQHKCADKNLAPGILSALALTLQHPLPGLDPLLTMLELAKSILESLDSL